MARIPTPALLAAGVRSFAALLADRSARRRRAAAARDASARHESAAFVLEEMARQEADYARGLPAGAAQDAARMQQYVYAAMASARRARAGGDHEGAALHDQEAQAWRDRLAQRIGEEAARAAPVVVLDGYRLQRAREAGL